LILATIGRDLEVDGRPVIDSASYSAILAMVILTTIITPPLLSWSLKRCSKQFSDHTSSPSLECQRNGEKAPQAQNETPQ
jgi:hypothetical protein